jgi:hypothetical protein
MATPSSAGASIKLYYLSISRLSGNTKAKGIRLFKIAHMAIFYPRFDAPQQKSAPFIRS